MAFDLMRSAKHIRGLSNAEFRVLFYLLDVANQDTFKCYPSIKKIAGFVDMSERTVQRHITALAERGLFEKLEQRRSDGSRAVNCYQFKAVGTMQIGNEAIIILEPESETDEEHQPANIDRLHNQPFLTGGGDNGDTTPRQNCRDIDQESKSGFRTNPPSSYEEDTPIEKGLFGDPIPTGDDAVIEFVESEWRRLKVEHPGIANIRKVDDTLRRQILLRARQHIEGREDRIDVWKAVFAEIRSSRFLTGRAAPGPGRDSAFKLSLGWACKTQNFREIINGRYSNERGDRAYDAAGNRMGPTGQAVAGTLQRMRASRERR